jgi:hypothetical protein
MAGERQILEDLAALPPDAQEQVKEFIAFLRSRQQSARARKPARARVALADEPFIGIWRDREDMNDSTAWVRETRQREWRNQT